jgi:peptidoglycan/xylan/chitin deacetylase (PgdA/CDA1 family)
MSLRKNNILKVAAIIIISLSISLGSFYFFYLSPRYTIPILTYHDFNYREGIAVAPENFERQMHYLKDRRYNVISLDALIKGRKKGDKFARNTVVITMDDGYKDNFTYAYPVLKKYGFPATIFLIANNIGVDENFLNWDEVREMSGNNISFGGHTKSHVYLPSIKNKDVLWDEIFGCKEIIERHVGIHVDYFSYPKGGFTEKIKTLVKKAGYEAACTTNRGHDILDKNDLYELNRISIRNCDNSYSLWAKLSGYYNMFRHVKEGD